MIDSPLYKELMVTDGSPDEKIISGVWGAGEWGGLSGITSRSLTLRMREGGVDVRKGMFVYNK